MSDGIIDPPGLEPGVAGKGEGPRRGSGLIVLCVLILVLAVVSCFGLDRYGKSSRRSGPAWRVGRDAVTPLVVASPEAAYRAWKAGGYRGRTVLYLADGWDRFDPNQFNEPESHLAYPIKTYRIADRIESRFLEARTFLFLATLQGIARRIVAVVSPENFVQASQAALLSKNARVTDTTVYVTHQGFPRWFTTLGGLPAQSEPVLLYVAASAFRSYRPQEVLEALRRQGVQSDAVILCSLAGDSGVSPAERLDLAEFAGLLKRGGA